MTRARTKIHVSWDNLWLVNVWWEERWLVVGNYSSEAGAYDLKERLIERWKLL